MKLQEWLSNNLWSIIIAIVGIIVMWTMQTGKVNSLVDRVDAVEKKQAEYPSKDWFELKFQNIDEDFVQINKLFSDHINDTK